MRAANTKPEKGDAPTVGAGEASIGSSANRLQEQATTGVDGAAPAVCDRAEIARHLASVWVPNHTYEMRMIGAPDGPRVGYFVADAAGIEKAATSIAACDAQYRPSGFYTTLNPVAPSLRNRVLHRDRLAPAQDGAAKDADVVCRRTLLIDCDPRRPKGTNATDAEVTAAIACASRIRSVLDGEGWPAALVDGMSGNGAHLVYSIDLPADDGGQVARTLRGIASRFTDATVDVDTTVSNPSRITKVFGTVARKGAATIDRPHRGARIIEVPDGPRVPVTTAQLETVAAWLPPKPPSERATASNGNAASSGADDFYVAQEALDQRYVLTCISGSWLVNGERFDFKTTARGKWAIIIDGKPSSNWIDEHGRIGAAAKGARNGGPLASHWCRFYGHSDAEIRRGLIELVPELARFGTGGGARTSGGGIPAGGRPQVIRFCDVKPERVDWLWNGRIPRGMLTLIEGDPGLGKSAITIDLAARVSTGAPMPFETTRHAPADVVLLAGEDHPAMTIRPRLDAAGADVTRVHALLAIDRPGDEGATVSLLRDRAHLEGLIRATGAGLVIIDPLMAYLGSETDSHKDQDVRRALAPLAMIAAETGAAIVIVRHLRKGAGPAMYRGGGSVGIVGAARSALLAARDDDDPETRYLAPIKGNLAPPSPTLMWTVEDAAGVPRIKWLGIADGVTADQLSAVPDGRDDGERDLVDDAAAAITALLVDGPVSASKGERDVMAAVGCSKRTVRRGRERAGVVAQLSRGAGGKLAGWVWTLDGAPDGQAPTRGHVVDDDGDDREESRQVADEKPDGHVPGGHDNAAEDGHLADDDADGEQLSFDVGAVRRGGGLHGDGR